MGKTKKIIALICAIFSAFALFAKPNLTQNQKENINLLVMMKTNQELCLSFNPNHKKVYICRIAYSDYEKGVVDYGDNDYLASAIEYNFSNGMVSSVNETDLYETIISERPYLEISAKGTSLQIVNLLRKENLITLLYNIKGGNIEGESAQNFKWGREYELIEKKDCREIYEWYTDNSKELCWEIFQSRNIIEFKSDGITYMKYQNGILMEEYSDGVLYRYTTANGKGEYQKKENGEFVTVATLERKTDREGYLVYQRLSYLSGGVSEIFIGDKLPDVSRLINRYYP
ncbi:hypothetical protein [uncultured Treponema sp.]|uniref:hypothetical protein n=1 Tax=uncultured Treponema sp. TaxID=162155 RepID=UPI002585E652|nr:hypothetical protein [uncultured Treponema sp.]